MKKILLSLIGICTALASVTAAEPAASGDAAAALAAYKIDPSKPVIILKFDDLACHNLKGKTPVRHGWRILNDYLSARKIKYSMGILADCLERDFPPFAQWVRDRRAEGVELWCHGYKSQRKTGADGKQEPGEFEGSYESQLETFRKCQKLAQERLGFVFNSFGPHWSNVNENTAKALRDVPEITSWMYAPADLAEKSGKYCYPRHMAFEYRTFVPDLNEFKKQFEANKNQKVLVLQGHPESWGWDEKMPRWVEAKKIIDFLMAEGCEFDTPTGYMLKHGKNSGAAQTSAPVSAPAEKKPATAEVKKTAEPAAAPQKNVQVPEKKEALTVDDSKAKEISAAAAVSGVRKIDPSKPVIILKFDDFSSVNLKGRSQIRAAWKILHDYLSPRKIKYSVGVFGNTFEHDHLPFYQWVRDRHAAGEIEFWCHNYKSGREKLADGTLEPGENEKSYEEQLAMFRKCQEQAKAKFGFPFKSFGPHWSNVNEATAKALRDTPEFEVWMYAPADLAEKSGKYCYPRHMAFEYTTFVPDLEKFKAQYRKNLDKKVLVLQGHPESWGWRDDTKRWQEAKKIIDFLVAEGCEFDTPYGYMQKQKSGAAK